MLAVPGWFESIRLPKATAVVMPLKNTARVSGEANSPLRPSAPCHDVVDLERDADAQQHRQRDDVRIIERHADDYGGFQRDEAGQDERKKRKRHVPDAPERQPEQNRNRTQRPAARLR